MPIPPAAAAAPPLAKKRSEDGEKGGVSGRGRIRHEDTVVGRVRDLEREVERLKGGRDEGGEVVRGVLGVCESGIHSFLFMVLFGCAWWYC